MKLFGLGVAVLSCLAGASPSVAQTSGSEPFSEDFTNATFSTGWTLTEPNPASSVSLTGTALQVDASYADGGSDLYSGSNYKASRLLQPVDPSRDWILETEFAFSPANNYSGAGLLLATTNGLFTGDNNFARVAERAFYPNGGGSVIRAAGPYVPFTSPTSYLRVQKSGTTYYGWISPDGVNWTYNGSTTDANPYSYVGLFVIRYPWDGVGVDSVANFYYFHVTPLPVFLGLQARGNQAVLCWPAMAAHFNLVSATNLAPTAWVPVTNSRAIIGNQVYVTNDLTTASTFYRLRYP